MSLTDIYNHHTLSMIKAFRYDSGKDLNEIIRGNIQLVLCPYL